MWFSADQPEEPSAAAVLRDFREAGPRFAETGIAESDTRVEYWDMGATLFEVALHGLVAIHALVVPQDDLRPYRASWSLNGLILDGGKRLFMPAAIEAERSSAATIDWMINQLHQGPPR